ncbi:MAG: heme lyase CcmF/NrfE family subunit [Acidobacteria bacterium]|nr:heme lyase CcmF/NrfE family subunit [Acidobacteriota bacterium]
MASFGNFCLLLSLCLSVFAFLASLLGVWQKQERCMRSAERAVYAATAGVALSFISLLYLLLANDFSISHVAGSSSRDLPIFYKMAAIWGAHDGSMLLWVLFAAILSAIVIYQNRFRYRDMMPYVLAVLTFNLSFFLLLNLFFSNPFDSLVQIFPDGTIQSYVPPDGQGLNPLLQHWAMVIHPPILYLGFIGFVVPFAFAFAALATKQLGNTWIRTTRRWTLLTWLLLGVGIILGGKWAYVVLGWGGYWAWDPVENSSLMPWLASTAFLHSVVVQERRGMLKAWNILLVLFAFLLGIFGTFITRSGIVNSVHAFADSNLGKFFLAYMAIILFGTLYLIADRRTFLKSERSLDSVLSRESAFLFNNFILIVSCFAVFWGTMFPVLSEAVKGTKITVGPPFFNNVNVPVGLILLFLTGAGPLFAWRKTSLASLKNSVLWPIAFSLITCIALFAGGMRNYYSLICLSLSVFVVVTIFEEFYKGTRIRVRSKGENLLSAAISLTLKNKRRYGGYIVHLGIALMFVGFAGNAFNYQATQRLAKGQEMEVGSYKIKMAGYHEGQTPTYEYGQTVLEVFKNGKLVRTLKPERRFFKTGSRQSTTVVALHSNPKEDVYAVFAGMTEDLKAEISVHINPLVYWIWAGSAILVFGSIITLLPDKAVGSRQSAVSSR